MAAAHSQLLPVLALELALQLDRYQRAMAELAARPHDEAARESALFAVRVAGPLAFAVPAVWPVWGQMLVHHGEFMRGWMKSGSAASLRQSWQRLEASAEAATKRCIDWSLREQKQHLVPDAVAAPFLAWDEARRRCFDMERETAPAAQRDAFPARLREGREACRRETARLLGEALAALRRGEPQPPAELRVPAGAKPGYFDYEALHERWRVAEEAACDAELAIVEMQITGLPVAEAQREFARKLRGIARECREAVFDAGRL